MVETTTYTVDGWSTSSTGTKDFDFGGNYTANANITLYPHFNAVISVSTQKAITLPSATRENYTFQG